MTVGYKRVTAESFCTLPFKQQMEPLINDLKRDNYDTYISQGSLATRLKNQWPLEDGVMLAEENRIETMTDHFVHFWFRDFFIS